MSMPASNLSATMSTGAALGGDVEDDVRVLAPEPGQLRQEHHRGGEPGHHDAQAPRRPLREAADAVKRGADVAERRAHLAEKLLSRLGRRHAACRPSQQTHAEPLLEASDRVAEGRGRDPEPDRGLREAALLGHGGERREDVEALGRHS
jgi:hypothetical protein